tara:strand:- start:375 stop:1214 length:840 start_codon:yes stop_codon:yes gene_type:complete
VKKIVWISSYPKSGNTWIRYFLCNYFYNQERKNTDFDLLNKIDKFPPYKYMQAIANEEAIKESSYNVSKYWLKIQSEITKTPEEFIFVKNHNALVSIEGRNLTDQTYSLAFIYIVRDPRDIAVSYSNFDKTLNIDRAIERITSKHLHCHISKKNIFDVEVLGSWKFNYLSWKNGVPEVPRVIIRFEDLIKDTYKTKLKIIKFLSKNVGSKIDEEQIKFSIDQSNFDRLKEIEKTKKFPESSNKFFNSGKIGQWKNFLSPSQLEKIENFCKEEMQELNYL